LGSKTSAGEWCGPWTNRAPYRPYSRQPHSSVCLDPSALTPKGGGPERRGLARTRRTAAHVLENGVPQHRVRDRMVALQPAPLGLQCERHRHTTIHVKGAFLWFAWFAQLEAAYDVQEMPSRYIMRRCPPHKSFGRGISTVMTPWIVSASHFCPEPCRTLAVESTPHHVSAGKWFVPTAPSHSFNRDALTVIPQIKGFLRSPSLRLDRRTGI